MNWLGCICLLQILTITYQKCSLSDEQMLITFHPHLDAFWLNTDTELKDINFRPAGFLYSMNQRNSKTIFNSMLESLAGSPKRKYFVTEVVFFKDWFLYLTPEKREAVKKLIESGQLEITNGGWVENDEAVCYYDDILDQYTLGMNYLDQEFNYPVKIGWATDSFGHSHSHAALEHLLGIEFQSIERVDDRYINQHKNGTLLQFYWIPISDSNNQTYGGVLNYVRHFLHEVNNLRGARVNYLKTDFEQIFIQMKEMYHKNKTFRFLGNDFEEFIPEQFSNLESMMNQLNANGKQECPPYKYGNPTDYLRILDKYYQANTVPTRKHDFIPNWDQDRFWTGYYTTDPDLKKKCKDFSRLVNLYRKILYRNQRNVETVDLNSAQQLLAVIQHHDGIVATSKTYIEDEFKNRIRQKSNIIIKNITEILTSSKMVICELYHSSNKCKIPFSNSVQQKLHIITMGNVKQERIELELPSNTLYELDNAAEFDIFCDENVECKLVFEPVLFPGVNQFQLNMKSAQEMQGKITRMETVVGLQYSGRDFSIAVDPSDQKIKYTINGDAFMNFGIFTSVNKGNVRQTMSWDKYGRKSDKTEHIVPGMYIMANTGELQNLNPLFNTMKIGEGKNFRKVYINSNEIRIEITIGNDDPTVLDFKMKFKPPSRSMLDYFLRAESSVSSSELYHDSNGYLVSKRILNKRPDYEYVFKKEDVINGNTYPACSFAYLIDPQKGGLNKFLFFSDRAQGVASFEGSLLINFDRLAMDDGKGVGEGYSRQIMNQFHYKFALTTSRSDIERLWQRQYDEANIAFISSDTQYISSKGFENSYKNNYLSNKGSKYLKYTIFYLNKDEIVLRLINLAEHDTIKIPKFRKSGLNYEWKIEELGIDMKFVDVKESYANGLPKQPKESEKWRTYWNPDKSNNEINTSNQDSADEAGLLRLRPLQIRSFRINASSAIKQPKVPGNKQESIIEKMTSSSPATFKLRKRCF